MSSLRRRHERRRGARRGLDLTPRGVWPSHGRPGKEAGGPQRGGGSLGPGAGARRAAVRLQGALRWERAAPGTWGAAVPGAQDGESAVALGLALGGPRAA